MRDHLTQKLHVPVVLESSIYSIPARLISIKMCKFLVSQRLMVTSSFFSKLTAPSAVASIFYSIVTFTAGTDSSATMCSKRLCRVRNLSLGTVFRAITPHIRPRFKSRPRASKILSRRPVTNSMSLVGRTPSGGSAWESPVSNAGVLLQNGCRMRPCEGPGSAVIWQLQIPTPKSTIPSCPSAAVPGLKNWPSLIAR